MKECVTHHDACDCRQAVMTQAILDLKAENAKLREKYSDLLQGHASLCGKIEQLNEELRVSNLQVDGMRKALGQIQQIGFRANPSDYCATIAQEALTEKRFCAKCGKREASKHFAVCEWCYSDPVDA